MRGNRLVYEEDKTPYFSPFSYINICHRLKVDMAIKAQ